MRLAPRPAIVPIALVTLVLGLLNAALLLPGVRPSAEYSVVIDVWLNMVVDAGVIAVVLLRALAERRERAAWLFLGAGLVAAFAASAAYFGYYQNLDPIPSPSLSDVGWLAFYALLYIGLLLRLRERVRRMLRSVWLDGLIAGLTATALATAYIHGARVPWVGPSVGGRTALYPLADLLLLAVGVAALAVLGNTAGPSWWLLCLSFVTFAVTDSLYAEQVAAGAYSPGDPVDIGWLLARLLLAAAAVVSLRARSRQRDMEGISVLILPAVCAFAVLGLLYEEPDGPLTAGATAIAVAAGAVIVVRTAFTFHELRVLTERKQRDLMGRLVEAQDDERARIADDVHDDSLQALAAVDLRLGALRRRLQQRSPDEVPGVETTIETVHEAAVRLRSLLFELETPVLEQDLADALREAAQHLFDDSGVRWTVEQTGEGDLPTSTKVSAYRIAREAMVNALKHAQASTVRIRVAVQEHGVEVCVLDDGLGVKATTATSSGRRHSGVIGMRDRASASGGRWRSETGVGGAGTRVVFFLPRTAATPAARGQAGGPLSADEQPPYDVGGARDSDHHLTPKAPAEQGGEVDGERPLEQVGRRAGPEHPLPGRGVGLR